MNYQEYFKNKKITVMGLGLLGRGVGDVKFLAQQGAILTVTDLKTELELKPSLDKLKYLKGVRYVLGKHELNDFKNCDLVLKAAGVPLDSPFVAEAAKNKIPVKMSAALFAKFSPATVVGVTGTRGKSTTAEMVFKILKTAGRKTFLGGNVRGVSTIAHLPESASGEVAVLELDSWQLQGFEEERLSPSISVFTTFYPDHLNYYNGNLDKYLKDKSFIFRFQKPNDYLILGSQCAELIRGKYPDIKSKIIVSDSRDISFDLKIPGEHNRYNAALAKAAAKTIGIEEEVIERSLAEFKGLPGRLELVREIDGVKIFNDTTSTTPVSTLASLKSFSGQNRGNGDTILIMGGADKGLDFTELFEDLSRFCKAVILLPGTGTEKIESKVKSLKLKVFDAEDLKEALERAMNVAEKGDIVLFSPAFASFGPPPGGFKNEFDRGEQFMKIIETR